MTPTNFFFYLNGLIALLGAAMALTAKNAVHGLLYFIVSILALAVGFYLLDAPLISALEIMVYAGAIMVLFVFVVMLLNVKDTKGKYPFKSWAGPAILSLVLLAEMIFILGTSDLNTDQSQAISVHQVAVSLFTDYALGIEIASLILMAGLIGAFHVGRKRSSSC